MIGLIRVRSGHDWRLCSRKCLILKDVCNKRYNVYARSNVRANCELILLSNMTRVLNRYIVLY